MTHAERRSPDARGEVHVRALGSKYQDHHVFARRGANCGRRPASRSPARCPAESLDVPEGFLAREPAWRASEGGRRRDGLRGSLGGRRRVGGCAACWGQGRAKVLPNAERRFGLVQRVKVETGSPLSRENPRLDGGDLDAERLLRGRVVGECLHALSDPGGMSAPQKAENRAICL